MNPHPRLKNVAVTLLQQLPEFRHVSRRLLADLVARAGLRRVTDPERAAGGNVPATQVALIVVVEGRVLVTSAPPGSAPSHRAAGTAESLADVAARVGGPVVELTPGAHWREDPVFGAFGPQQWISVEARRSHEATVVLFDAATLSRVVAAAPLLAGDAALRRRLPDLPPLPAGVRAQLVWIASAADFAVPLEAMAHLLAATVGSYFDEPVGLVTLDGGARLAVWHAASARLTEAPLPTSFPDESNLLRALTGRSRGQDKLHHLFFVHPANPRGLPAPLASLRFHRIVYVTKDVPEDVPHDLEALLRPDVREGGAAFVSFVPTVILGQTRHSRPSPLDVVASLLPDRSSTGFKSEPVEDGDASPGSPSVARRLRRDVCRLRLDPGVVEREWRTWRAAPADAFPAQLFRARPAYEGTAQRWARAVTNRQVGIALSGGGASSYRVLPLLSMLERRGVPIDVFSGVSGGALIGAYYCALGLAGLKRVCARGPQLAVLIWIAAVASQCIERFVDFDLGGATLDDLEVRFVPVATALRDPDPPEAHVIVAGTLGEAVRASGSAPMAYGPTEKGDARYVDGATATFIPAKILTDYGADVTLACSCIPGPARSNPLGECALGRFFHRWTLAGRLVDGWVASAYLLEQASRRAGLDADVFWAPTDQGIPLAETVQFERADAIVEDSRRQDLDSMRKEVERLHVRWTSLWA